MAEEHDKESQTEDATEKRIADAIEKGNVPFAREATLFGSLAAIALTLFLLGNWAATELATLLREVFIASAGLRLEDREAAATFFTTLVQGISFILLPLLAVIAAGSVLAALLQNVPAAAMERITPRMNRISLFRGWTRLYGKAGLVEFAKSVAKIFLVSTMLWYCLKRDLPLFASSLLEEPALLPGLLLDASGDLIRPFLVFSALLALADLIWSRIKWRNELRMSQHEVRQEMKEAEGDPLLKARARTIGRQRASRNMFKKLPTASVVITNPTHYAVALRYSREDGGAPVVIAKGLDHLAMRIREVATEHAVPLVENKPLARGLYEQVEIDQQIPPEFYRAVAEIIHYLSSRGRLQRTLSRR